MCYFNSLHKHFLISLLTNTYSLFFATAQIQAWNRFFYILTPLHFHPLLLVFRNPSNLKTEIRTKPSTPNFPKNEHFLPSDMHAYVCVLGVGNVRLSENLATFAFLLPPFWDSSFCLTTDVLCITNSWIHNVQFHFLCGHITMWTIIFICQYVTWQCVNMVLRYYFIYLCIGSLL